MSTIEDAERDLERLLVHTSELRDGRHTFQGLAVHDGFQREARGEEENVDTDGPGDKGGLDIGYKVAIRGVQDDDLDIWDLRGMATGKREIVIVGGRVA